MPRLPIIYSKTIIYKIVCKNPEIKDCYVGQTTNFTERKNCHKSSCNNINNNKLYNLYVYQFIREHDGWDNWDMVEIEKYNATDKLNAGKRERYWIEQLQATLNKQLPTRTGQEYYEEHKDKIKEYNKEYSKEYYKEYYTENKDKLKEQYKEYRVQNIDKIKEYQKEYYTENKDKIQEYRSEQISCVCGTICRKDNLKRHERSNNHIEFLKTI